ncbi:AraC family transcriptional regulator [Tumebacillus sp. BK434]|uniref:AraC family transcriptional regulator n=1 Tax=Tumebacillus sp. BK434 TaxID=2512169 RepID=UPI0010429C94|nr:AraC family transcriptional regulator [Tumebacillus sp. BK434]TCP47973.1 AraC family transcriptional regulator [Tumebacillus sp. BK434]
MNGIARVQQTIEYIEDHLTSELELAELAAVACYSAYHFHRLFQMLTGMTVMNYIRNRRLDRAACELIRTKDNILDIALEYGFGSHETFTRAFKRVFQTTPGAYRKQGKHVPIYPRVNLQELQAHSRGGIEMTPTILNKPEIKVLGYLVRTSLNDNQSQQDIQAFWQRYLQEGLGQTIPSKLHPDTELGIIVDNDCETGDFSYLIGYEVAEEPQLAEGSELTYRTVPAATYAVFTTPAVPAEQFSKSIQETWGAIFRDWFPTSGYEHAATPELELYDSRSSNPEAKQMDICIPIQKS